MAERLGGGGQALGGELAQDFSYGDGTVTTALLLVRVVRAWAAQSGEGHQMAS